MKFIRRILAAVVIASALSAGALSAPAPQPKWETVEVAAGSDADDRIDATVRDGYIYVTAARPVNVKVFTILGQLVSQSNLPAGTSRFKVGARGIYILKAGSTTIRVTI